MRDNAPAERILFSLFRSFVPIGIVSKARTTCCQVCMYRVGSLDALFFMRRGQSLDTFTI